ncbi:MAG: tetratricopeptide repeat protein [Anaerolineae bacterium]|nr:tetratricopeptide repeat protein [Anaerolineae bacterium]
MSWLDRFIKWASGVPDDNNPSTPPKEPKGDLERALDAGRQAQYSEDYEVAMRHFENALSIAKAQMDATGEAEVLLHQADVLMAQGRFDDAEKVLSEVQSKAQRTQHRAPLAYALISRGLLAQGRGAYEEARNLYEQGRRHAETIHSDGAQGRAQGHLADIYLTENNSGYAVKLLRDAIKLLYDSGDTELLPYFQIRLADALIALEDTSEVMTLLHAAYKQASEEKHIPYRRLTAMRLAKYAFTIGDYTTTYQFYKIAFGLFKYEPAPSTAYVDALLEYSQAALQLGEAADGRDAAELALTHARSLENTARIAQAERQLAQAKQSIDDPTVQPPTPIIMPTASLPVSEAEDENPVIKLIRQAEAEMDDELYDKAIQTLIDAIKVHSQNNGTDSEAIAIHRLIAEANLQQFQTDPAIDALKQAQQIAKKAGDKALSVQILTQIADEYTATGRPGDALRFVDDALLLLSSIQDVAVRQRALRLAGTLYGTQGDTASADAFFDEALNLVTGDDKPGNLAAQTHLDYAIMLAKTKRPDLAREHIEKAKSDATESQLAAAQGQLEATLGNWPAALTQFEIAYQAEKQNAAPDFETDRARALVELGRYDDARPLLQAALKNAREYRNLGALIRVMLLQSQIMTERGKAGSAIENLGHVLRFAQQAQSPTQQAFAYRARSHAQAIEGDQEAARADWEQASQLAERHSIPLPDADWLTDNT